MANSDPPDKIYDRESPTNRDIHTPDSNTTHEQVANRVEQSHRHEKSNSKADKPSVRSRSSEYDRADLVGDRAKRVPGLDHRRLLVYQFLGWIIHARSAFQFRIRVANFREIRSSRTRVQFRQQPVIALLRLQL